MQGIKMCFLGDFQIYSPTDHTNSSYGSNPSTPVSSPPPGECVRCEQVSPGGCNILSCLVQSINLGIYKYIMWYWLLQFEIIKLYQGKSPSKGQQALVHSIYFLNFFYCHNSPLIQRLTHNAMLYPWCHTLPVMPCFTTDANLLTGLVCDCDVDIFYF